MVKSNQPLQIRLTEPVIFLKGPSTGLDFRGRPQAIAADAQPAMLRGLLTLRLSKPTRIRKIEIKLEGKARTEWPEGIGSRRMDTSEEQVIISEKTTYFNAIRSESKSDMRRTASVGPGIMPSQWDLDEGDMPSELPTPTEIEEFGYLDGTARTDRFGRGSVPRSASALPVAMDGSEWRSGMSRRTSTDEDEALHMRDLSIRDRGPSPAYTPRPEPLQEPSRRASSLRNQAPLATPSSTLSPIHSVAPSRAASDRDASSSTERRAALSSKMSRNAFSGQSIMEGTVAQSPTEELLPTPVRPSILDCGAHRQSSGEVRFAEPAPDSHPTEQEIHSDVEDDEPEQSSSVPAPNRGRAASVRTMNSNFSASTSSLNGSHEEHGSHRPTEPHPVNANVRTAVNSPILSPAPSVRGGTSTDQLPRSSMSSASLADPSSATNSGNEGSRRSSLLGREILPSTETSASSSALPSPTVAKAPTQPNQEVRAGRKSRIGGASTIVINNDMPGPSRPTESRQASDRSASGSGFASHGSNSHLPTRQDSHDNDERQHRHLKFSLASALGAVKGRMASKSRSRAGSRAPSRGPSRPPSIDESRGIPPLPTGTTAMSRGGSGSGFARVTNAGSVVPSHVFEEERTNRFQGRTEEFVPGYGRGGAGRIRSRSTDRTASPVGRRDGERSPSRNRGRHKGMKVLTGALGVGDSHAEEDGEHLHNWKEFKKGVYNYPISFPIPVDSPPTVHAEFGSVVYRLKATVVRVGALTSNLVEDVEVTMIATPQEDDLEESENVIVERQWEEQMRYQIALHGKAFPIGGTIPVSIRLMPLMKCKIHRLTVSLEEKTDYFAQEKKVARHETPKKFTLLFVKQPEKFERTFPLLPIISDDPNAAKDSPVAQLAAQAAMNNPSPDAFDPENDDSVYATLLDPLGPWHLEKNLQIPDCATQIKFTSKHEKTNITVGHWLKVIIRVERGDDVAVDAKGRRKQFDIIIETPIKILDCRVNSQYNSLPTYTPRHPLSAVAGPSMCTIHSAQAKHFAPIASTRGRDGVSGFDPLVSSAPGGDGRGDSRGRGESRGRGRQDRDDSAHANRRGHEEDTLLERNIVYDRLMSGQETETGELPPSYGEAVANAIRSASRSASRQGRNGPGEFGGGRGREFGTQSQSTSRSRSRLRDLEA